MTARRFATAIVWLALLLPGAAFAEPAIPPLTGRVVDAAHVLDDWTRNQLDGELASFETSSGIQLVVVTLPDLGGDTIEDWGLALGRGWGIGQKGKNSGVLLIVAPKDRQLRIEVGYGLEGELPDATANGIVRDVIVPRFRSGDMPGGIRAGVDAIIVGLGGKVEGGAPLTATPSNDSRSVEFIIGFARFFVLIVLAVLIYQRRRRSGLSGLIYSSTGGGSSSGGGGFSGGGGSFGGGGASGGW